jgi:hypothetical protein
VLTLDDDDRREGYMVRELDPLTVTPAELIQARRSLQIAKWVGAAVGVGAAALAFLLMKDSDLMGSPLAIIILVVAGAGSYRAVYELLLRVLPPR